MALGVTRVDEGVVVPRVVLVLTRFDEVVEVPSEVAEVLGPAHGSASPTSRRRIFGSQTSWKVIS